VARFRYALQPALDLALARERSSLAAYAEAASVATRREAVLAAVSRRERDLRARSGLLAREHRLAASLVDAAACYAVLERERDRELHLLRHARDTARTARFAAARETQRRTALECRRTHALEAWREREDLRATGELDEANLMAQARNGYAWKDLG